MQKSLGACLAASSGVAAASSVQVTSIESLTCTLYLFTSRRATDRSHHSNFLGGGGDHKMVCLKFGITVSIVLVVQDSKHFHVSQGVHSYIVTQYTSVHFCVHLLEAMTANSGCRVCAKS